MQGHRTNVAFHSGKVGTGFDSADLDRLARKFKPLEQTRSPFEEVPAVAHGDLANDTWSKPRKSLLAHYV